MSASSPRTMPPPLPVAAGIRDSFGRGLALVGQDNMRRTVLRESDVPGGANIGLIDMVVRYSLDAGYHVVVEGILYYLDIPIEETVARHASKADPDYLAQVTERELRAWYRERDLLPDGVETVIGADSTLADRVERIMCDTGLAGLAGRVD
ncbi:kinase [Streptomyces durmitorensis]|uniref:Kinase n=1 Tax=Streptomyces durmitorensis TaxID=319947 RepID=A0ABY4PK32_9ACTN|nr:kinase [Streptomyces durmitorensis]UQT53921.1 kinase [Streptomyces durmitorensis]